MRYEPIDVDAILDSLDTGLADPGDNPWGSANLEPCPDCATPQLPKSRDRIYPRCVWCNGENYMPAVLAYSAGEIPCAAVNGCNRFVPEDYRRATS